MVPDGMNAPRICTGIILLSARVSHPESGKAKLQWQPVDDKIGLILELDVTCSASLERFRNLSSGQSLATEKRSNSPRRSVVLETRTITEDQNVKTLFVSRRM